MSNCDQELCPNWAGDAGCICAVFNMRKFAVEGADIDYYYQSRDEIVDYQDD